MSLKTIKSRIKKQQEPGIKTFRDGDKCSEKTIADVKEMVSENTGQKLKREQESLLIVKRSMSVFTAISWFKRYFDLVGDYMPNTDNEIHLEACDYRDLYEEYMFDVTHVYKTDAYLSFQKWRDVWKVHFDHVRVREYKQVSGKCNECEMLSDARKREKTVWGRQLITDCHAFHRYLVTTTTL